MSMDIDIVIPWVDDSDEKWRKEYLQYKPGANCDSDEARYRDWNVFKYWFRGIEKYAPWVRKIHFLTYGHIPSWLDTTNPKLNIVNHKDFIPEKYLPTFSSHPIELNMHRIPDLAEHFIYFNDDVYLTQPTKPEDFFVDGKPVDTAVMAVVDNEDNTNFMPYIMLNILGIINMEFPKKKTIKNNKSKWFSPKYGKGMLKNMYLYPFKYFTGFSIYHSCNSFCKSTFEKVWDKNEDTLDLTCSHKFRSKEDVNQYLMRFYQLCEGNFCPHKSDSTYVTIGNETMETIETYLYDSSYKVVCINDDPMGFDFETEKAKLENIMEKKFGEKSSFEL